MSTFKNQRVSLLKASKILGIGYNTIRRYVADGRINVIEIGTRKEITLGELERFQKHGNAKPEEEFFIGKQEPEPTQSAHPAAEPIADAIDEDLASSNRIPEHLRELAEPTEPTEGNSDET